MCVYLMDFNFLLSSCCRQILSSQDDPVSKDDVSNAVKDNVTPENAVMVYQGAVKSKNSELEQVALACICK